MPFRGPYPEDSEEEVPPRLPPRPDRTDDRDQFTSAHNGEEISIEEQTALLEAMTLEAPPGAQFSPGNENASPELVQTPTNLSTEFKLPAAGLQSTPTTPLSATSTNSSSQSKFTSALQNARHFAGGLLSHPYDSTRHYSILRHSSGIVYYTGPSTNLAITIFSDEELPINRTLWLQRRGVSGKTGLKLGALRGARSTWINITPSTSATAEQIDPDNERAWQRDIKKFLKKAPKDIRSHRLRETDILRIPCDADDGYLRVVLCTGEGKRTLCGSPIFRLASSSTDTSVLRGSSLMTLPLEAGVKVASSVGKKFAIAAAGPYVVAARAAVSNPISSSTIAKEAIKTAYNHTGGQSQSHAANERYNDTRAGSDEKSELKSYDALGRPNVVGLETGPDSPFPVRFQGKVVTGTGRSRALLHAPTANLTGVPDDILLRYEGVFFGWAAIQLPKKLALEKSISDDWYRAIITIARDLHGKRTVVHKNTARVHLIHEFGDVGFVGAKLSVIMMGYLRESEELKPDQSPDVAVQQDDFCYDVAITNASLARPTWAAEATLERVKSEASKRSLSERYVDFRKGTQGQIDRIPIHRLGVRMEGTALKDRLIGQGGICILRSPLARTTTV